MWFIDKVQQMISLGQKMLSEKKSYYNMLNEFFVNIIILSGCLVS